jgi:hypothetical protein
LRAPKYIWKKLAWKYALAMYLEIQSIRIVLKLIFQSF